MNNLALKNHSGLCWRCLKSFKKKQIRNIIIPDSGYGSIFDGSGTRIQLCEECYSNTKPEWWKFEVIKENAYIEYFKYEQEIFDFLKTFPVSGQELMFNKYRNNKSCYMDAQDWIDYELGVLSYEKCKKYGIYSNEEKFAFKTRFPKCKYVFNLEFEDGTCIAECPFGALSIGKDGEFCEEFECSPNCYNCQYFKKRTKNYFTVKEVDENDYKSYLLYNLKKDEWKEKFGEI